MFDFTYRSGSLDRRSFSDTGGRSDNGKRPKKIATKETSGRYYRHMKGYVSSDRPPRVGTDAKSDCGNLEVGQDRPTGDNFELLGTRPEQVGVIERRGVHQGPMGLVFGPSVSRKSKMSATVCDGTQRHNGSGK